MSEADILATTYTDLCTVYRPEMTALPTGESKHLQGLDGEKVYTAIPCALSSPTGGKLQHTKQAPQVAVDYRLFVRPTVDIRPKDTVVVTRLGQRLQCEAGLADRYPSHNNVPLKIVKVLANE